MMRIGKVAKAFGYSTSAMRSGIDAKLGLIPVISFGGQRLYETDKVEAALKTFMQRKRHTPILPDDSQDDYCSPPLCQIGVAYDAPDLV
jgi:hypothetical protein